MDRHSFKCLKLIEDYLSKQKTIVMLKKILKLEGAYELTKMEQKNINGGITKECADAIYAGFCVRKGSSACPSDFPNATTGGCCCGIID